MMERRTRPVAGATWRPAAIAQRRRVIARGSRRPSCHSERSAVIPSAARNLHLKTVQVTRTYLELTNPGQLRGVSFSDPRVRVELRKPCPVATYRRLYKEVGED